MSSFGAVSRHLMRRMQSVPLPKLKQGTTLSIRSRLHKNNDEKHLPLSLTIKPAWRDDGHAELSQVFPENMGTSCGVQMIVKEEKETKTTIGRMGSHVSIELMSLPESENDAQAAEKIENMEPGTHLLLEIPEKLNVMCDLRNYYESGDEKDITEDESIDDLMKPATAIGGSINVTGKIEGDVKLYTTNGEIQLKKLRGHMISLQSGNDGNTDDNKTSSNLICATSLIEAQKLNVLNENGRFRAKQIHCNLVDVRVQADERIKDAISRESVMNSGSDDEGSIVDISALFVSGNGEAAIDVQGDHGEDWLKRRAVRIKSNHGPVQVQTFGVPQPSEINEMVGLHYPLVELGGVNGNCEISIEDTKKFSKDDIDWPSAVVHVDSLSPDSVSLVSANEGDISMTLDRKSEADIRIVSLPNAESLTEVGALLAEEEDSSLVEKVLRNLPARHSPPPPTEDRIHVETKAFTKREKSSFKDSDSDVEFLEGWVENRSAEPDSRFERKVRGEGSVGKINISGAADQALKGFNSSDDGNSDGNIYMRPLLAVAGTGRVVVETVSWLGAIARRYGLDEDHKGLGRTASRRGREIKAPSQ